MSLTSGQAAPEPTRSYPPRHLWLPAVLFPHLIQLAPRCCCFPSIVFMRRSHLLPDPERRLEENGSAAGGDALVPIVGQCRAVWIGFPYGVVTGLASPSASGRGGLTSPGATFPPSVGNSGRRYTPQPPNTQDCSEVHLTWFIRGSLARSSPSAHTSDRLPDAHMAGILFCPVSLPHTLTVTSWAHLPSKLPEPKSLSQALL